MNQPNMSNWDETTKEWFEKYIVDSPENNPFRKLMDDDGIEFSILVPMRYSWVDAPKLIREFAEKVAFPKDREIIIYTFFLVTHDIMVDDFFILEEDDEADLEDIIIDFGDFRDIDFSPLYEFIAEDAKKVLTEKGYDVSDYQLVERLDT